MKIDQNDINMLMFLKSTISPLAKEREEYNRTRLKKTKLVRFILNNATKSAFLRRIQISLDTPRNPAIAQSYKNLFNKTISEELYAIILSEHIIDWEVYHGITAHKFSENMFQYLLAWHNDEDILAKKLSE